MKQRMKVHDFLFIIYHYFINAAAAAINFESYVFNTLFHVKSYNTNFIYSPSPISPCVLANNSSKCYYSIVFSTTNKCIISSDPPGDTNKSYKYFISLCNIVIPVSSFISFAATPPKSPYSSIIPAGASNVNFPTGTLNCYVNTILPFTNNNIATASPLKNTNPGNFISFK